MLSTTAEATTLTEKAIALHQEQQDVEAVRCLDLALKLEPRLTAALYLASDIALSHGDYTNGWPLYEYRRWKQGDLGQRYLQRPMWDGQPTQKRVLIWAEQGYGDAIMMCRFFPEVRHRAPNAIFAVHPELTRLMRVNGTPVEDDDLYTERINGFDVQCSIMSLPLVLGLRGLDELNGQPYLRAPFANPATMVPARGPNLGLFWKSNSGLDESANQTRKRRNLTDEDIRPLSQAFDFVSLQREHTLTFDWAHTAVVLKQLDLIVTVDSAIAHLAGAMGKPTYLMLSTDCDWRWLQGRGDTPWYDSVRLYRQERAGDWSSVVGAIADDLKSLGYRTQNVWPAGGLPTITPDILGAKITPASRYMMAHEHGVLAALLYGARTIVEIGVQDGETALMLLREVPTINRYIGVDVLPGYHPPIEHQQQEVPQQPGKLALHDYRFELLLRKNGSHDLTVNDLPVCDAFIIDGDHSAAGVRQDTELAYDCLRPGGIVIWHDYSTAPLGVREVLEELFLSGGQLIHVEGTWLVYERRS